MLSCILSFYVFLNGLHATNLRANYEQFSLKIWEKLKPASLNFNITGSYKRGCIHGYNKKLIKTLVQPPQMVACAPLVAHFVIRSGIQHVHSEMKEEAANEVITILWIPQAGGSFPELKSFAPQSHGGSPYF